LLHVVAAVDPLGLLVTVPGPVFATVRVYFRVAGTNEAVTRRSASIVRLQVPVPLQAPLQPVNTLPLSGVAESVTALPASKFVPQVAPQSYARAADRARAAPSLLTESW
jgi:hypothetical protein